jgi:hypothetical protein
VSYRDLMAHREKKEKIILDNIQALKEETKKV